MSTPPSSTTTSFPTRPYVRIKIVSLGDASVGKSCLIKRYCEKKFVPKYISTIGVDFGVRQVKTEEGVETKVNFWDLSGSSDFYEVRNEFHRHSEGVLLVYDVTSLTSFQSLPTWLNEHTSHGGAPSCIVVCANKCDETKRTVSESEGRKWAEKRGYQYYETSAKSGTNVNEVFHALFKGVAVKAATIATNAANGKVK